jgi:hypothetical protein
MKAEVNREWEAKYDEEYSGKPTVSKAVSTIKHMLR